MKWLCSSAPASPQQGVRARPGLSGSVEVIRRFCCYPAVAAVLSCTDRRLSRWFARFFWRVLT